MTTQSILEQLAELGSEQTRKTYRNHGAKGEMFGVKIGDLKPIQKKIKKNYELSLALFDTANLDAMYLAGLVADEKKMTLPDFEKWVRAAGSFYMIGEYTIPWVAAESSLGWTLANAWRQSETEHIAASGWATLSNWVISRPDEMLDTPALIDLLNHIKDNIHHAPNRVRYCMNNFVIAVGVGVSPLTELAKETARSYGKVHVEMGNTACKVPEAISYIDKAAQMGRIGKKKKELRC